MQAQGAGINSNEKILERCIVTASDVLSETALLRKTYPAIQIHASTAHFLTASYERTPHARVRVTVTFPENYPSHALIVTVDADHVVPPGLKKKLERELGEIASQNSALVNSESKCHQLCPVFHHLITFVDKNKFLPCWKELRQCVALIKQLNREEQEIIQGDALKSESSTILLKEKSGKIVLCLRHSKYHYKCSIVVNDGYPSTIKHIDYGKPLIIQLISTNVPPKMESLLTTQARELVRRMQEGLPGRMALLRSNPIKAPEDYKDPSRLNHESETLSMVRDLHGIDATTKQGKTNLMAHDKNERKDTPSMVKKNTQDKIFKNLELQEKDNHWQLEQATRMAGYSIPEFDGSDPQPCLNTLFLFLIQHIQKLPEKICPMCHTLALPSDPNALHAMYEAKTCKTKRPVQTYCGCWYHYNCLTKCMTNPPFGVCCPAEDCGRRVYHPDFPAEIQVLERAWTNRQAREREIEDAALFM